MLFFVFNYKLKLVGLLHNAHCFYLMKKGVENKVAYTHNSYGFVLKPFWQSRTGGAPGTLTGTMLNTKFKY